MKEQDAASFLEDVFRRTYPSSCNTGRYITTTFLCWNSRTLGGTICSKPCCCSPVILRVPIRMIGTYEDNCKEVYVYVLGEWYTYEEIRFCEVIHGE